MSDLKIAQIKRKISKSTSNTLAETFAITQLFKQLEELVNESHNTIFEQKAKELARFATDLYSQLHELTVKLQKTTENDINVTKKDLERQKNTLIAQINQVNNDLIDTLDQYKAQILLQVNTKVETILSNVESFRGPQGIPGKKGKDGKDGSPDTPDQVVEKVNTAGKKIKITAIEGLTDELRKARRENGGKFSGGMGNPQHETHNVNSSSTVITLTYSPAAAGRAIWMYYQGQHLVYGTDFTVNERSVALLFTPVDNTYVDVTYLRG